MKEISTYRVTCVTLHSILNLLNYTSVNFVEAIIGSDGIVCLSLSVIETHSGVPLPPAAQEGLLPDILVLNLHHYVPRRSPISFNNKKKKLLNLLS